MARLSKVLVLSFLARIRKRRKRTERRLRKPRIVPPTKERR